MREHFALALGESDALVPIFQFGVLCDHAYSYTTHAKVFRPGEGMSDKLSSNASCPVTGKDRKAFQITGFCARMFQRNAPHDTVFIVDDEIRDTAARPELRL